MAHPIINSLQNLSSHKKLKDVFKTADHLMDSHDKELKANIGVVLKHYQCSNDLDKLIKTRLINRYKCFDEVLNLLKSEDLFEVAQALQCSWFFENSEFDPQLLVDCVLPLMSYTTRFKVLKKYSKSLKNPGIAATFFSCLKQRYGLNSALLLLPACEETFIQKILMNSNVQIHVSVLLSIFHVYPSVLINYLSHLLENASAKKRVYRVFTFSSYEKLFILLAKKEPLKFTGLMEKYHRLIPYMRLGKRSTKQLVRVAFNSIKNNPQVYKRILNWKFVVPCLNLEQISELQFNLLPKTVSDFFQSYSNYSEFVLVVSSLKESIRKDIIVSNFQRAYNKPMIAFLNVMDVNLVPLLPTEVKESWVEAKVPTLDNPCEKARHIVHLPTTKSLPLLQKMVEQQTDLDSRKQILECLVQTVLASDNQVLIKDVCLYVLNRFRNDRYVIREVLLSALSEYKHLLELSEDCWVAIEEIININILENEVSGNTNMALVAIILKSRIHGRLQHNLPVNTYLEKLLKLSEFHFILEVGKNTPYEKYCLEWFLDNLPEKKLGQNYKKMKEHSEWLIKLIERLCQWNAYHSEDRIDFPEWLNTWITELFESDEDQYCKHSVLEALKIDEILKHAFYRKIFPHFINPQILTYNLHQDPELISRDAENLISKILNDAIKPYHLFFKQCRLYPGTKILDIISVHCIKILTMKDENNEEITVEVKRKSVQIISVTVDTIKFIDIIKDFCPTTSVVDDYSDEGRELFQLQTAVTNCMKYVSTPTEVLETLRKFAVGDYLKLVVGSLNSICLRTSENKILKLLKEWFDCPVSLKKHFYRAYLRIAPIVNTMETIVGLFENEKNMSLRILLFDHGLRLFQKEPSPETFMLLKSVGGKLNSADDASITKLLATENVPDEFVSEYVQFLWNIVNHNIENEVLLKDYRSKIIALIEPDILQFLSEEFSDILIKEVFLLKSLDLFIANYLLDSKNLEQLSLRCGKIFDEIKKLMTEWDDFDLKSDAVFKNRRTISFFIDCLVRQSFSFSGNTSIAYQLLQKVKTSFMNSLKEYDILEEILLIEISGFFLITSDNDIMHHFLIFIEQLVDKVVSAYGSGMIDTIMSIIKKTLSWKFSKNIDFLLESYLISLSEILFTSSSNNCFILGLKLLPTVITSEVNKYRNFLPFFLQKNDPVVRLYVNKLFKELSSNAFVE